jgi:molybdenum cofactor guanylyltransferase
MQLDDPSLLKNKAYINGQWVEQAEAATFEVTNPANGEAIASVPDLGQRETQHAIEAANDAWPAWRAKTGKERANILRKWFDLVMQHQQDLAKILSWEQGKPLAEHVIDILRPQVDHLLISANRHVDRYRAFGHPVVEDALGDYQGPLAGFATLMQHCSDDWLVTAPCDAPRLPPDFVARLWAARQQSGAVIAVAHDGQRLHPVHVLLSRHLLPDLNAWLARGERKIRRWYQLHPMTLADFSDAPDAFLNLNTPQDHQALTQDS